MTLSGSASDRDLLTLQVNDVSLSMLSSLRKTVVTAFKPLGFTYLEAMTLLLIERGHDSPTELAQLLCLVLPGLSAITAKLVEDGFLIKKASKQDHRRVNLTLAKKGKQTCQELKAAWAKHSPIDTSTFTNEEISAFIKIGQSLMTS